MNELKRFKREIRSIRPITLKMKRKVKTRTRRASPVKRTASYYARSSQRDGMLKAKKVGKRRSASGRVYYESRRNHADKNPKKRK
jgi:hypothetical protein